jgi:hypothetical protein
MKTVHFIENQFNLDLNQLGYAIFHLLSKDQIKTLLSLFEEIHEHVPNRFFASTHLQDKKLVVEISDKICGILNGTILEKMTNAQILGAAFIVKPQGTNGILPLHQDWNLVDEQHARTYNLWIPLVDVSSHNGAMKVLEASHNKEITCRGLNIPSRFRDIEPIVQEHMTTLEMKAGQALLYDHALWHSSPQNHSDKNRVCLVVAMSPLNVDFINHQKDGETITTFKTPANYLLSNYGSTDISELVKLSENTKLPEAISWNNFKEIYLNKKQNFFEKMLKSLRL